MTSHSSRVSSEASTRDDIRTEEEARGSQNTEHHINVGANDIPPSQSVDDIGDMELEEEIEGKEKGRKKTKTVIAARSTVWEHFDKFFCEVDKVQKARCKYCSSAIKADPRLHGTNPLRNHFKSCKKKPQEVQTSQSRLAFQPSRSRGNEQDGTLGTWRFDQGYRRLCLSSFSSAASISAILSESFRRFCSYSLFLLFLARPVKMSSLRNAIPRRAHKERAQPHSRRKFGLLEKHKDYVERAQAYHKKEQTIQKLKEKAAFRNPDEFYFKMIKTKSVGGVHRPESVANRYTKEELMLMRTQDIGYILQKLQTEKKKIERLKATLHSIGDNLPRKHVYYAEDREEAREIERKIPESREKLTFDNLPEDIQRKTAGSYRELEARKSRVKDLEKLYMDKAMEKELQKKGKKRKLREDEIVNPTSRPVYKWKQERKR